MPRDQQSSATSIWLDTEYLERPLLARTLIQRCHPSVVSSSRAACSMRSRSALRRASRSSSVGGLRLKRRAIVGSLRLGGPPRWRADGPPPARPLGRATIGWRVGPPAGGCDYATSATAPSSVLGSAGWRSARRPSRAPASAL